MRLPKWKTKKKQQELRLFVAVAALALNKWGHVRGRKKVKKSMRGTYSSERRRRRASKMHDVRSQAFSSDLIAKTRLQHGQEVISILVLDTKDNDNSFYSNWFARVNDFIQRF